MSTVRCPVEKSETNPNDKNPKLLPSFALQQKKSEFSILHCDVVIHSGLSILRLQDFFAAGIKKL